MVGGVAEIAGGAPSLGHVEIGGLREGFGCGAGGWGARRAVGGCRRAAGARGRPRRGRGGRVGGRRRRGHGGHAVTAGGVRVKGPR